MHAPETEKPCLRPYLAMGAGFASGADTPRDFLARCLAALDTWEPRIGAFVHFNLEGARAAAEASTERWRTSRPLSAIDGMPIGVKDVIETVDMPTEMGSPLFAGWQSHKDAASVAALREAGAVILGKTVTTEFAATEPRGTRNPWDVNRTPGGSSSGSASAVGAGILSAALGTQVLGSVLRPASFCGCFGFKPTVNALNREGSHDYQSQSCTGVLAASLEDAWQVAYEIAARVGGDAGHVGLSGPDRAPAPAAPRRLAFLKTAAWPDAAVGAKQRMDEALSRFEGAGVEILTANNDGKVAAIEAAITVVRVLSTAINNWEMRWFLRTCCDRDASKLSANALARLKEGEQMTRSDYRAALVERARIRALYAELAALCDGCVMLAAPGPAPVGLHSTGDPRFNIPASLIGSPAVSLPVFEVDAMPVGLQVMGFAGEDAATFATAAWALTQCQDPASTQRKTADG
jgi:Asp-tRNA(Asn)/Glu-tRNA(Gln) amidotransferase A subunit family amidase